CVITDGGGAIVVTKPEVAKSLKRPLVRVLGAGEAVKHQMGGKVDLTYTAAVWSGPAAFAEAGVTPSDVKYVSIYDSFTITVLIPASVRRGKAASSSPTATSSPVSAGCPSTPMAAASAATTRATAAGSPRWSRRCGNSGARRIQKYR